MSDYLSTLAARSLRIAPVVTPRLASRFEPASPASGSIAAPPLAAEQESAADRAPRREPAATTANETLRVRETRVPAIPVLAPMHPPIRAADESIDRRPRLDERARETHASREAPAPAATPPPAASEPVVAAVHAHGAEPPAAPAPPSRESDRRAAERLETPVIPIARLDDVVRRLTGDRLTALERRAAREGEPAGPAADRSGSPPQAVRPSDVPAPMAVKPSRVVAEASPAETPAPIVRVTIGRVEVRAVMPPPVAPPKAAAPPSSGAPSLDEYLKQRSGVRR